MPPSLVREAGSKLVTQLGVPYRGTWASIAAHQLTPDAIYASLNVFLREGKLQARPGLNRVGNIDFDAPIIGGGSPVLLSGGGQVDYFLTAISKSSFYELSTSNPGWVATSTGTYAVDDDSVIDMAFVDNSGQIRGVVASPTFVLKQWINGAGLSAITPVSGPIPTAISVCVAASRVVAMIDAYTLQWTATKTIDDWPNLAINRIAQTADKGICVRTLSNLSFVAYKERSIYMARAQSGTDAAAFAFSEPIIAEGPAGVRAVVQLNGFHMYMTANGRIGVFNGTAYPQWIADGLWFFLQSDVDSHFAYKIFGVYDYIYHTVTFFYPRQNSNGQLSGMVTVNLPLEGAGLTEGRLNDQQALMYGSQPSTFLGVSSFPCTHGYDMHFLFNNRLDWSMYFGTPSTHRSFVYWLDQTLDDGQVYGCAFQTGLAAMPEMQHHHVSFEPFFERADGYGTVTVRPVTSKSLETPGGTIHTDLEDTIDLNTVPEQNYYGFNVPTRFFGLQYSWLSSDTVKYAGTAVYGRPTTMAVR